MRRVKRSEKIDIVSLLEKEEYEVTQTAQTATGSRLGCYVQTPKDFDDRKLVSFLDFLSGY